MYCVAVTVKVKPEMGEAFLAEARKNREGTRQEAGNIRFDVLRGATSPVNGEDELFYLWEVYESPEAFAAHQQTAHYFAFKENVEPMMAQPRAGLRLVPVDADPWIG